MSKFKNKVKLELTKLRRYTKKMRLILVLYTQDNIKHISKE